MNHPITPRQELAFGQHSGKWHRRLPARPPHETEPMTLTGLTVRARGGGSPPGLGSCAKWGC
jgi:hypothetical protein